MILEPMSSNISIEEVKDFWNRQPCNIKHSKAPIGSVEYFNEVEERKYFVEPHIPKFAEFARWSGKKVLEVGCGIGTDAVSFCRAGAQYVGLDLSSESVSITKKRLAVFGLSATVDCVDVEEVNHKTPWFSKFDLIYSFGVLHHTVDISKALSALARFCHQDTVLKIMVYAKNSWKQKMINAGLDQPEAQFGCPIANSYTAEEISTVLNENGFKVTSIRQDHIFPYKVKEYKNYEYVRESYFEAMPLEVFRVLEENFGWHLLVEATLA